MNRMLEEFLRAEDLDDALSAREELGELDSQDEARIVATLRNWQEPQAVANLLMNPTLIPAAERGKVLLRGLRERRIPYYVLAAVVGLQQLKASDFSRDDAEAIRERLLQLFQEYPGVIAQRASLTLPGFVTARETDQVVELLNHPDPVVRHNILFLLISLVGLDEIRPVIVRAAQSGHLSPEAVDFCSSQFAHISEIAGESPHAKPFRRSDLSLPLLTYIPNLRDSLD